MYLALYRKYRPSTFDDVISQEHITTTLKNQIAAGQIAHAYLFTGTRGTGKTSCAKIMAKAVNCLSPVNGNPCGKCKSCQAIADGSTDIIEIDAASNNGVDSIRQIRDEIIYTPIDCKYKVYIIDEVHMLSDSAFNALLKTLEEPPGHVVFILATTEYYKVPATILSRCQQFLFSKIDPEAAKKRLLEVAEKENISLTENAAALIARLSDGAMRDAWSLLDQCISSVGGQVDEEAVRNCSGAADSSYLFSVTEAAINRNPADALKLLDGLIGKGKDVSRFIEELTLHIRNIMLAKSAGTDLIKGTDGELKRYREQSGRLSLDEIMRQADLVSDSLDNINRMKQTGQGRLLTEQLLIRLCSPALSNDAASLAARLGALEKRLDNFSLNIVKTERQAPEETSAAVREIPAAIQPAEVKQSDTAPPPKTKVPEDIASAPKTKAPEDTPPTVKTEQTDFPFDLDDDKGRTGTGATAALTEAEPGKSPTAGSGNGRTAAEPVPDMYYTGILLSEPPIEPPLEPPFEAPPFGYEAEYIPMAEPDFGSGFDNVPGAALNTETISRTKTDKPKTAAEENSGANAGTSTRESAPKANAGRGARESAPEANAGTGTRESAPETEAGTKTDAGKNAPDSNAETGSEPLPITESNIELPENIQPLAQWEDIIALLPASSKNILKKAQAFLYEGKIYVDAPPSALSMMKSGRRAVKLRDAVKTVMGGKLDVFTLPEKNRGGEEKEDLVTPFLERARGMGIEITVRDK